MVVALAFLLAGIGGAQTDNSKPVRLGTRIPSVFVESPTQPNYDQQVLEPLHAAQARQAALEAAQAAERAKEAQLSAEQTVSAPVASPAPTPVVQPTVQVSGPLAQWLLTLRLCESSGNYAENTGNGFYGAYQFTIDTWNHWGTGYSRADLAPSAVQDATIIKNTLASAGLQTQNPGCYAKGNLSNYPPAS